MPPAFSFEDFSRPASVAPRQTEPASPAPEPSISSDTVKQARLEGYDEGYKAGWDDAAKAQSEDQDRIGAEFARNLQDLGFTFHEARRHVMHALEPLLNGMVAKVLPELITRSLGQTVVEELLPLASTAADAPIEIVVSPESRTAIEPMLRESTSVPFVLIEEPSLAEGQVFLRSGQTERHIDMEGVVMKIGAAIESLYELNEKAFQHG